MPKMEIQFDGGCSPNPGNKYGSYQIKIDGGIYRTKLRTAFGHGTNNEAEFDALHECLQDALWIFDEERLIPKSFEVEIITDSRIVLLRLRRKIDRMPKTAPNLNYRAVACLQLLSNFAAFTVEWRGREHNVALFGH